jgi:aconitate hydratase
LQFVNGESVASLGLTGRETFDFVGLDGGGAKTVEVVARSEDGSTKTFTARVRIDTPKELEYYRHGGILQYVLRNLAARGDAA